MATVWGLQSRGWLMRGARYAPGTLDLALMDGLGNEVCPIVISRMQLSELSARIELESRIRDGARNMLQILEEKQGNDELRGQIQHKLDMAEEQMNSLNDRCMFLQTMMQERAISGQYLRPRAIRAVHGLDDLNMERPTSNSPGPLTLPESRVFPMPEIPAVSSKKNFQSLAKAMALVLERWMTGVIHILPSEWADVLNTVSSLFKACSDLKKMMDTRVLMLRYVV